ncbi:MAG: hypothetical protein KAS72_04025 [Phycisphaerales bacterium]|nr:hypothetical protein [Phycisphaerales bacterium]
MEAVRHGFRLRLCVQIDDAPRPLPMTGEPTRRADCHRLCEADRQIIAREVAARLRLVPDADMCQCSTDATQCTPPCRITDSAQLPAYPGDVPDRPSYALDPQRARGSSGDRAMPARIIRIYQPIYIPITGSVIDLLM